MTASFAIRLGAWTGWIGFFGIVIGFIAIPTAIAGPPPTISTAPSAVIAYFAHPEFALINGFLGMFFGLVAIVPFGWALRTIARASGGARAETFGDLGFWFLLIAAPIYTVSGALDAMLVQAATANSDAFAVLFRLYDVLYNGAADVLEGAWIGAFAIAALGGGLPRSLGWLGLVLALSRWIKAGIPFLGVPEAVATLSGVLFVAWFLWAVVAVTRVAMQSAPIAEPGPVAA